jgi:hypothetical protein
MSYLRVRSCALTVGIHKLGEATSTPHAIPSSVGYISLLFGSTMDQILKAAQAYCDSETADLKKLLDAAKRREKEDKEDRRELKQLNEQLIEENQELKSRLRSMQEKHREWRNKYNAALSEKIALLRQHEVSLVRRIMYLFSHQSQPNPVFPIEVFAIVAGFAAGANDYAGVAAMCATSQLMHAELKPVLYETVVWNQYFQDRLALSLDQLDVPALRDIRYAPSRDVCCQLTCFFPLGSLSCGHPNTPGSSRAVQELCRTFEQ